MSYFVIPFKANNDIKNQLLEPYINQNFVFCDCGSLQGHKDFTSCYDIPTVVLGQKLPGLEFWTSHFSRFETGVFTFSFYHVTTATHTVGEALVKDINFDMNS